MMNLLEMSKPMTFELITIFSLFAFTIFGWIRIRWLGNKLENCREIVWELRAKRVGTFKESFGHAWYGEKKLKEIAGLCEEQYLLGNRIWDDIYVDTAGKRVKIYMNVQKQKIYITVLKGQILYRGTFYTANEKKRIEVMDMTKIVLDDLELEVRRREGDER